jgi:ESS family glutamate:Na+ symporter
MIVGGYMFYAILGIAMTIGLAFAFDALYPGSGILLSLGYGQGPTQAFNIGMIFQDKGMENGLAFGLAIASLGFVWASIGGLVFLNRIARRRGIILRDKAKTSGEVSSGIVEEADEIPLTECIDKFTIQVCLIGFIYLLTMGFNMLLDLVLSQFNGTEGIIQVFWGFNFCFAIVVTLVVKVVIGKLRKGKIMNRKYVNNYMLNRIAGFAFDILIVASLASLELAALGDLWIPLLIITSVGGIGIIFYVKFCCKRLYPTYEDEAFVTMYGMLTGTLSNGIILLRELDPEFKTPAALDQIVGAFTALIFGIPMLILIPYTLESPGYYYILGVVFLYFWFLIFVMLFPKKWSAKIRRALSKKARVQE